MSDRPFAITLDVILPGKEVNLLRAGDLIRVVRKTVLETPDQTQYEVILELDRADEVEE